MKPLNRRHAIKIVATAGLAAVTPFVGESAEPDQNEAQKSTNMTLEIPASLKAEHDELHEELVRATKVGGKTGEAAEAVAKVLHPHFVKEEQLAMPPLGLLGDLAAGRLPRDAAKVVELTDKLNRELPAMLKEHEGIVIALETLAKAAQEEKKPAAREFATKLKQHAKVEEEVLYPAAILVGEYIKLRLSN